MEGASRSVIDSVPVLFANLVRRVCVCVVGTSLGLEQRDTTDNGTPNHALQPSHERDGGITFDCIDRYRTLENRYGDADSAEQVC